MKRLRACGQIEVFRRWTTLVFVIFSVCSCAAPPSHENFERVVATKLGRDLGNVVPPEQLLYIGQLPNGNREYREHFFRTCNVIYEVSPVNVVMSWKYAGDSKDCYINP